MRGYKEEGTTTTPFDMVVLNEMSRYHLASKRCAAPARAPDGSAALDRRTAATMLDRHRAYIVEHLEDMPEVRDWVWTETAVSSGFSRPRVSGPSLTCGG